MIAIPAFVFLFLEFFGENVFSLRYLFPVKVSSSQQTFWDPSEVFSGYNEERFLGSPGGDTLYLRMPSDLLPLNGKPQVITLLSGPPDERLSVLIHRLMGRIGKTELEIYNFSSKEKEISWLTGILESNRISYSLDKGIILLKDEEGYFRGIYDHSNPEEHERVIIETEVLLSIEDEQ